MLLKTYQLIPVGLKQDLPEQTKQKKQPIVWRFRQEEDKLMDQLFPNRLLRRLCF